MLNLHKNFGRHCWRYIILIFFLLALVFLGTHSIRSADNLKGNSDLKSMLEGPASPYLFSDTGVNEKSLTMKKRFVQKLIKSLEEEPF